MTEGSRGGAIVLTGKGTSSHQNMGIGWWVCLWGLGHSMLVGAFTGCGGTPLPRDGSGPDWVKWWERPKSPEALLTEKQGSPRRRERAGSEAAGKEAWAAQSSMGPSGHQLDGDESPCRELGSAQPSGGLCLVEITAPLPWGVLRGRPRSHHPHRGARIRSCLRPEIQTVMF